MDSGPHARQTGLRGAGSELSMDEENASMARFLNNFVGRCKQAKEIRVRVEQEEFDKEAIVQ